MMCSVPYEIFEGTPLECVAYSLGLTNEAVEDKGSAPQLFEGMLMLLRNGTGLDI